MTAPILLARIRSLPCRRYRTTVAPPDDISMKHSDSIGISLAPPTFTADRIPLPRSPLRDGKALRGKVAAQLNPQLNAKMAGYLDAYKVS
ncbi:hypothetical protein [Streptomyces sp. NPDC017949]|uniref:hypothetical protein n=1 Tax=Streptomyces sp. NPDC017949 TaxID=3365020 RepID=UPI0037B4A283